MGSEMCIRDSGKDDTDTDTYGKIFLKTKFKGWSYEDEARILFDKNETYEKNDLDFFKLTSSVRLSGIVLGPLCDLENSAVESVLPKGTSAEVVSTRLGFKRYEVVKNKGRPPVIVTSSK